MIEYTVFGPGDCPSALYKFRYTVYVEEMGRKQRYACHETKSIQDYLDATAANVVAFDGSDIVGCVRINFLRDGNVGDYEAFYDLGMLSPQQRQVSSICTRLMVRKQKRSTSVPSGVMKCVYEYALTRGIDMNYIDCNAHLVSFFSKFGYRNVELKEHAEYGNVSIMLLHLRDGDYLRQVKSPFSRILSRVSSDLRESTVSEMTAQS